MWLENSWSIKNGIEAGLVTANVSLVSHDEDVKDLWIQDYDNSNPT